MAMQIIVLGMHRSGTSAVSRLLNLSGAYFGPDSIATPTIDENPKGYWERKDMRALCDDMLHAMDVDWWCPSGLDLARMPDDRRRELTGRAKQLIDAELAPHGTFFIKEPRLCLLFPLFRPLLERPVVVNVLRDPLEVARSLRIRNGFPIHMGIALWEYYQSSALGAMSLDCPLVTVRHADVIERPAEATIELCRAISEAGGEELTPAPAEAVHRFVDRTLYRSRSAPDEVDAFLTPSQRALWTRGDGDPIPPYAPASREALESFEDYHRKMIDEQVELRHRRSAHQKARRAEEQLRQTLEKEREALRGREAATSSLRERVARLQDERDLLAERVRAARAELSARSEVLARAAEAERLRAGNAEAPRPALEKQNKKLEHKLGEARAQLRRYARTPGAAALVAADKRLRRAAGWARNLLGKERVRGADEAKARSPR